MLSLKKKPSFAEQNSVAVKKWRKSDNVPLA